MSVVKTVCFTVLTEGGAFVAVNPDITILLDLYGDMLTQKERDTLDYYYNDDLSLKEIADNESAARRLRRDMGYASESSAERDTISRQGVRDTIKRAEKKLLDYDAKLHLVGRSQALEEKLDRLEARLAAIDEFNRRHGCYSEISDNLSVIASIIAEIKDEA